MHALLARRWFLLLLGAGVGLALGWPQVLRPVLERLPVRGVVALSLGLTAVGLEGRRLAGALRRPGPALGALAVSYGVVPLLALAAGALLAPDLRLGLLLMASGPCTLATAVLWTRLAGGDEALALLIVVLSTCLSPLLTTPWLALGTGVAATPAFGALLLDLLLVLVLPVAVAQVVRLLPGVPAAVVRRRAALGVASRLLILAILLRAAVDASGRLGSLTPAALLGTAAACLGVHLTALGLALAGARTVGLGRGEGIAVAFGGSQKTLPVSLFLYAAHYQADYPLAVLPPVLYHVGQLVADTFIADGLRRRQGERAGG
jgi:sodium/bile acid cotransporter 7